MNLQNRVEHKFGLHNYFSSQAREVFLAQIPGEDFDLCIIGGGITGAGVARDAASRGMRVCLLEQDDFASGTSSRSSKLIHGGIRYLENLEFHLVFEALNERRVLFEIAPHLVHPLTFVLPVYESSRVGMFKMGLGMWLYDALALFHTPKFHQRLSFEASLHQVPYLKAAGLKGSYLYSDAYMDDDRLVLETLRSAHSFGAKSVNYVKVLKSQKDEAKRITALECEDLKSNKKFSVKARHFISTVGPWTDIVGESLVNDWKKLLRPSKGIHFTIPHSKLPVRDAIVMATDKDKRIIFAIPRGEIVIIGTTDTDYPGDPAGVHSELLDVDYLIGIVEKYFSHAKITKKDIIASYAGVRPLVHDGSATESKTSREHVIKHTNHNITFVAGGKYTTYRRMARDIVELVLKKEFSLEHKIQFARNQTRLPINPLVTVDTLSVALSQAEDWAKEFSLSLKEATVLAQRHGMEALNLLKKHSDLVKPFTKGSQIWQIEASRAIEQTMCLHLKDFMLRRCPLYLTQKDHGMSVIGEVADLMQKKLGWTDSQKNAEVELYVKHIAFEMGWQEKR
ncbi:MAG: glycerol-3-phosphate dehydrogenase/oxidase [Oligoflexia bacterium]|nr:glycerol-3-phosphate dehydrogenase/oxidase [Oligoflexia bacterium]